MKLLVSVTLSLSVCFAAYSLPAHAVTINAFGGLGINGLDGVGTAGTDGGAGGPVTRPRPAPTRATPRTRPVEWAVMAVPVM